MKVDPGLRAVVGSSGTWARSLLSPRTRFLPGLGARLATRPSLAAATLVGLRKLPSEGMRDVVFRNVSTPLATRMEGWLDVPVAGGFRMRLDAADVSCRQLLVSGTYEPGLAAVFRDLLGPGDVCVDVGAHVGYFTLLASRLVGPTGHVYSFEPDAGAQAALKANLDLNGVSNVTALEHAAGAEDGEALLHTVPPGNTGRASLQPRTGPREGEVLPVTVRRLATVLAGIDTTRLRLVKIDVEGTEADVLNGLEPLLEAGARPVVVVELHPALWDDDTTGRLADSCERSGLVPYRISGETRVGSVVGAPAYLDRLPSRRQHVLLLPRQQPPGNYPVLRTPSWSSPKTFTYFPPTSERNASTAGPGRSSESRPSSAQR